MWGKNGNSIHQAITMTTCCENYSHVLYLCVNHDKARVFFLNGFIHSHLDRRRSNWRSTQKLYLSKSKEIVLKYSLDKA